MLCSLCETSLTDLIHRNVAAWKRLNDDQNWYAFRHGDYYAMTASANAGCELCQLFNEVRRQRMRDFDDLAEKWHRQSAMIDVLHSDGSHVFQLLTEAPEKSWIPFEFFKPNTAFQITDLQSVGNNFSIPFQVSPDARSTATIELARRWINDCLCDHPYCIRHDEAMLPTRVIDVGSSDQVSSARLHVNPNGEQYGQYVTLSHCWGTVERLTTTKKNYEDFQESIPVSRLSQTFRDAIELTRLLGMRYLWLDALCIIQDDRDDWRRESATMCSVYENAAFSISAVSASDSDSGLFIRRSSTSCIATIDDTPIGVRPQLDSLDVALSRSSIESRAWCMQERILAPAILHLGPQQWYWECRAAELSESYPSMHRSDSRSPATAKHRYIPTNASHNQLLDIWYNLVGQYSARELTKPSDRLPAIAGLADKLARELGEKSSRYRHGLWADDLLTGFLWQRPTHRYRKLIPSRDNYSARTAFAQTQPARFKTSVAPTWSWASVRGGVTYDWKSTYTSAEPSALSDLLVTDPEVDNDPVMIMTGFLRRGTCRLRRLASGEMSELEDEGFQGNAIFKPSGSLITDEGVMCILDDAEDVIPKSCYCLRVSTWRRDDQPAGKKKRSDVGFKVFYLILERLQGPEDHRSPSSSSSPSSQIATHHQKNYLGKFRRIGMGYDDPRRVETVFVNAGRHSIELV